MKRKVKAAGFRVVIKLKDIKQDLEEKTESGIIVETKTKSQLQREQSATQEAYVVDIGPTAFQAFDDGQPWCKVGDCVLVAKFSGDNLIGVGDEEEMYRIINDRDVMAIFPEDGQ